MMKRLGMIFLTGFMIVSSSGIAIKTAKAAESFYTNKEVTLKAAAYDEEKYRETDYANYFAEPGGMSRCEEFAPHAHEYTDGVTTKWIPAENDRIDGLEKTDKEPLLIDFDFECDVEDDHAHLYYAGKQRFFVPVYSHQEIIENELIYFPMVSLLEKEKAELLLQTGTFRVADQLMPISWGYMDSHTEDYVAYLTAKPVLIDEKSMVVKSEFVDFALPFDVNYVNNLLYPYRDIKIKREQKEEISKDYKFVTIPVVDEYQRDNVRLPYQN